MLVLDEFLILRSGRVEKLFFQKPFQRNPASPIAAISLWTNVEFVDGMDFPKGGAAGVAGNGLTPLARCVTGIEQKLAHNTHRQFLLGHDVNVIRGPGSGAMVRNHLSNNTGALIRLRRSIHDGNVDVVIRGDVSDIRAAVGTFRAFLTCNQDETLKSYRGALTQGLERFAISSRAWLTGNRMIAGIPERDDRVLLHFHLKSDELWDGDRFTGT